MMKKFIIIIFFLFFLPYNSFAEIIENKTTEERNFGDWKVLCKEDVMMDETNCKAFSKFYNNLGTIYIQPHNKIANQVVMMIPPAVLNTEVKVRIDKHEVISSRALSQDSYGVVPFSSKDQKTMLQQMKAGKGFFVRFFVEDKGSNKNKEITIKISLAEFTKMLMFYDQKISN